MKLYFLGTGAGVPSKERNVSSIALELLQELGSIWLFDCGEATQHQILHTNIRPRKIDKIFISHLHGDHIYGLPGFLSSRSFQSGETPLTIYGPKGIEEYVETSLRVSGTKLAYPLNYQEVFDGLVFEDESFQVFALQLKHGVPSFGYKVVEKDILGELIPDKLKDAGITPGPIYREIKENEKVTLSNGEIIYRADFIGPDKPGRKLCIFGDTRYDPDHQSFIRDTDVLVHEATFEGSQAQLAHDYFHSTTKQAATLASSSNVDHLILTHISSRYQKDQIGNLKEEAQTIFPQTTIAHDFYEFEILSKKSSQK
ncbi:ribonuclease Z [Aquibacillus koreensis]|uniref:Ribonuclease Z n=1 Tax=Aquibacillus koreensis TaxID=279446 RepID=A0A9X3WHW3_9BACI|nr:ribonuclease Z [Aquibacillus koreensis]MCT2537462.1 ribonuclease Z [Aquibacillus koreensis]MDC3418908.1 ribonuclease Z [Aquibacillus koreensis]